MDKTVVLGNNNEPDVPSGIGANNAGPEPFLRKGHLLKNRYEVLSVLGHGGFGLTYACVDRTLDLKVAVKEYYPDGFVSRDCRRSSTVTYSTTPESAEFVKKGLHRFIDEARVLAKFSGELGIVDVRDYFEENNTAYIVMEFLDGKDLKQLISEQGRLSVEHAVKLLLPVMESLEKVHRHGLIHRDISPDNIRMVGKRVKLLDFGAARDFSYEGNKTMTVLLKRGYAPIEQYGAVDNQGPWTDVYALCATLYLCITGRKPADALVRWENDPLQKPSQLGVSISPEVESVIMKGLSVSSKDRYQSMKELAEALAKAFKVTTTVSSAPARVVAPASAPVRPQMPNPAVPAQPKQPVQKKNPVPSQPSKPAQPSQPDKDKPKNNKKLIIAVIAAVLALVVAGVVGYIGWRNGWFDSGSVGYVGDTYYEDETTGSVTQPSEFPIVDETDTIEVILTWSSGVNLDARIGYATENDDVPHIDLGKPEIKNDSGDLLYRHHGDNVESGEQKETITIYRPKEGTYYFYVEAYVDSYLIYADATVTVTQKGRIIAEYTTGPINNDGYYWNVFAIKDGEVIGKETATYDEPDVSYVY